jgi:hypothetical protein
LSAAFASIRRRAAASVAPPQRCRDPSQAVARAALPCVYARWVIVLSSGLKFPEPDNSEALRLAAVIRALGDGARIEAAAQLAPLVGRTTVTHRIEKLPTLSSAPPRGTGRKSENPHEDKQAEIFVRDGFACRYCCRLTIPPQLLRLIAFAFQDEYPYHANWKEVTTPRAYWDISTSLDHKRPVSSFAHGDDVQDPSNLRTVCARCQYQKRARSLDQLGWDDFPAASGWTGLVDAYERCWVELQRPNGDYHRHWRKAFAATVAKAPDRWSELRGGSIGPDGSIGAPV